MIHTSRSRARVMKSRAARLILSTAVFMAVAGPAAGDKPAGEKRRAREIGIMERTIDEVLVESRNLLVGGRSVTQGLYLDGIGAVFTFSMDVIPLNWGLGEFSWWDESHHVEVEDDGERIIIYKSGRDDGDEKGEKSERKTSKRSRSRDEAEKKARERYAEGKAELVDALLDYGAETLGSLADGEWVVLAARLSGGRFFLDAGVNRIVIKAKMGDLRALDAGTINREAARGRIQIDES